MKLKKIIFGIGTIAGFLLFGYGMYLKAKVPAVSLLHVACTMSGFGLIVFAGSLWVFFSGEYSPFKKTILLFTAGLGALVICLGGMFFATVIKEQKKLGNARSSCARTSVFIV